MNADGVRIERVLANLVHNAMIDSPSSYVDITLDRCDAGARVSVIDSGRGMTPDEAAVVFDEFRHGKSPHGHEGTKLGLYVGRRIVEAHGGTIGVESRRNIGSRFYFVLPIAY